jgi:hypothetical protein
VLRNLALLDVVLKLPNKKSNSWLRADCQVFRSVNMLKAVFPQVVDSPGRPALLGIVALGILPFSKKLINSQKRGRSAASRV